jgi:hypothetical protein
LAFETRDTLATMTKILAAIAAVVASVPFGFSDSADYPNCEITNGLIRAKIYLPDRRKGFYRGTRFDWSGVIYSLQAGGHNYYGPWFNKTDPSVHDFVYRDADIVAGPCSAITGPVNEFEPVGYEEAKAGGTFVKIGVGALRKPDDEKYDNYHLYEIADGGKWTVRQHADRLEFVQRLEDANSGYAYTYEKKVLLSKGKAEMVLEHELKNIGKRAIRTSVYNHNFLVLDQRAPGPGLEISVPFTIRSPHLPQEELAAVRGNRIVYLKTLQDRQVFAMPLEGFGESVDDNTIRLENTAVGAGMKIASNRPLLRESLWSIRTVVAMEPFISIDIEPGADFSWTTNYEYYPLPAKNQRNR